MEKVVRSGVRVGMTEKIVPSWSQSRHHEEDSSSHGRNH